MSAAYGAAMTRPDSDAPLAGLRVLELATGVAGPYAGRLMAMLGATVVKVEPSDGDPMWSHPVDGRPVEGTSPAYIHLNAGKANVAASEVLWALDPMYLGEARGKFGEDVGAVGVDGDLI